MSRASWDVVIIGAGAAGLSAARALAEAGRSILLLEALDIEGSHWTSLHGQLRKRTSDLFEQVQRAMKTADVAGKTDTSFQAFLDQAPRYGVTQEAVALARGFVQGFDAADPTRVSAQSIAEEWRSGGMLDAPQSRPSGGYSSLIRALAGKLDRNNVHIQLQTTVRSVRWQAGAVEIEGLFIDRPFSVTEPRANVRRPPSQTAATARSRTSPQLAA